MGGDGVGLISPRGRPPPPAASRPPGRPQGKRKPSARKPITQDAAYTSTSGRLATSGRSAPGIYPQGTQGGRLSRSAHKPPRIISTRQGPQALHKPRPAVYPGIDHNPPGRAAQAEKARRKLYRYQHKPRLIRSHKRTPKVFYIKSTFYYFSLLQFTFNHDILLT